MPDYIIRDGERGYYQNGFFIVDHIPEPGEPGFKPPEYRLVSSPEPPVSSYTPPLEKAPPGTIVDSYGNVFDPVQNKFVGTLGVYRGAPAPQPAPEPVSISPSPTKQEAWDYFKAAPEPVPAQFELVSQKDIAAQKLNIEMLGASMKERVAPIVTPAIEYITPKPEDTGLLLGAKQFGTGVLGVVKEDPLGLAGAVGVGLILPELAIPKAVLIGAGALSVGVAGYNVATSKEPLPKAIGTEAAYFGAVGVGAGAGALLSPKPVTSLPKFIPEPVKFEPMKAVEPSSTQKVSILGTTKIESPLPKVNLQTAAEKKMIKDITWKDYEGMLEAKRYDLIDRKYPTTEPSPVRQIPTIDLSKDVIRLEPDFSIPEPKVRNIFPYGEAYATKLTDRLVTPGEELVPIPTAKIIEPFKIEPTKTNEYKYIKTSEKEWQFKPESDKKILVKTKIINNLGEEVGILDYELFPEKPSLVNIDFIKINKEYRNRGIATDITNQFISDMKIKGKSNIQLTAIDKTIKFWSERGFVSAGIDGLMKYSPKTEPPIIKFEVPEPGVTFNRFGKKITDFGKVIDASYNVATSKEPLPKFIPEPVKFEPMKAVEPSSTQKVSILGTTKIESPLPKVNLQTAAEKKMIKDITWKDYEGMLEAKRYDLIDRKYPTTEPAPYYGEAYATKLTDRLVTPGEELVPIPTAKIIEPVKMSAPIIKLEPISDEGINKFEVPEPGVTFILWRNKFGKKITDFGKVIDARSDKGINKFEVTEPGVIFINKFGKKITDFGKVIDASESVLKPTETLTKQGQILLLEKPEVKTISEIKMVDLTKERVKPVDWKTALEPIYESKIKKITKQELKVKPKKSQVMELKPRPIITTTTTKAAVMPLNKLDKSVMTAQKEITLSGVKSITQQVSKTIPALKLRDVAVTKTAAVTLPKMATMTDLKTGTILIPDVLSGVKTKLPNIKDTDSLNFMKKGGKEKYAHYFRASPIMEASVNLKELRKGLKVRV